MRLIPHLKLLASLLAFFERFEVVDVILLSGEFSRSSFFERPLRILFAVIVVMMHFFNTEGKRMVSEICLIVSVESVMAFSAASNG